MNPRRIAASVCAIVALAARHPPAVQEFPFEFKTRQPIVSVKVNGGGAVPFVVDTGATFHVIDRDVLHDAITARGRSAQISGGGQATVDVRFVDGLTFDVGGVSWSDQRAAVASLGYPDRKHFAGLIGAPILMRYAVQFAFPTQRIRLIDPATYTPPSGAVLIPFELQEDLPIVRVSLDAGEGPIEARVMVDTGASQFIDLNRPFVEKHRLVEIMKDAKPVDRPAGLGGSAPFLYGTARRVTLGGLAFDGPRIGLSRATGGSSARSARDGILGNDLLRHFIVTVDYRRRVLALERP